jgi:hypothetical protein
VNGEELRPRRRRRLTQLLCRRQELLVEELPKRLLRLPDVEDAQPPSTSGPAVWRISPSGTVEGWSVPNIFSVSVSYSVCDPSAASSSIPTAMDTSFERDPSCCTRLSRPAHDCQPLRATPPSAVAFEQRPHA